MPAVLDAHVFDMTRAIQLAVAPVFLLTAIGAIINALMGRLGRAVDRRRKLEELMSAFEGETRESMGRELAALEKRIKLVFWAMAFAVMSALLVCLLIGTAFLGAIVSVDLSKPVAGMFVLAIGALTVCLLAFLREVALAATSDRARFVG
jgi:hypothetical protein